jgi:hypothetical protein
MYIRVEGNDVWACLEDPDDFRNRAQPYEFCIGTDANSKLVALANARQDLLAAIAVVNSLIVKEVDGVCKKS